MSQPLPKFNHLLVQPNQTKQTFTEFPVVIQKAFLAENAVIEPNQKVEVTYCKFKEPMKSLCVLTSALGYINLLGQNIILQEAELFEFKVTGPVGARIVMCEIKKPETFEHPEVSANKAKRDRDSSSTDEHGDESYQKRRKQTTFQLQPSSAKVEPERALSDEAKRVMHVPAMPGLHDTSLLELTKTPKDGNLNGSPTPTVVLVDIHLGDSEGLQVKAGSKVKTRYYLTLSDGTFVAAYRDTPMTVDMNDRNIPLGFRRGLIDMKKGGRRVIVVPSELGYGMATTANIPSHSTLVYDCSVIDFD